MKLINIFLGLGLLLTSCQTMRGIDVREVNKQRQRYGIQVKQFYVTDCIEAVVFVEMKEGIKASVNCWGVIDAVVKQTTGADAVVIKDFKCDPNIEMSPVQVLNINDLEHFSNSEKCKKGE